ncbi:carbon-nitrogen hydrolase [Citrobacter koseri]|nr:carbon-nitrogen hydrolase [Citrobacter koseri]
MTTILTIHVPSTPGRAFNMQVALCGGKIVAHYAKLHLYDAFSIQESRSVDAGDTIAPLLDVEGIKVGLMTCYDLRFPELALALALQGADILVLPAAWVRGALKEHHWATLLAARALDSTCYIVAAGECGNKNIGPEPNRRSVWRHSSRCGRDSGADYGRGLRRARQASSGATSRFT